MFRRFIILGALAALVLSAQSIKLYLQGGGDMVVREYEVQGDRVRYYSLERSQWEEIPLSLVDLEKTEKTAERNQRRLDEMRAESAEERAAERKARTELHNVPIDEGVYHYLNDQATPLEQREVTEGKSKKRGFLQVISPVKVIAGKTSLTIEGGASKFVVHEGKPIFYMRLDGLSRFGIVKVLAEDGKDRRVVQTLQVNPTTKEFFEEQDEVQVFRHQVAGNVYRVWPVNPLEPGEYAVVNFTAAKADLRVWDFAVAPTAGAGGKGPSS